MNSKLWKILIVALSLGIIFSYNVMTNAHSINGDVSVFISPGGDYNGSMIIAVAQNGYNVNGVLTITPSNDLPGSAVNVTFQNGTEMAVHITTKLKFHFSQQFFQGSVSGTTTGAPLGALAYPGTEYLNISNSHPVGMMALHNVKKSYLNSPEYSSSSGYFTGMNVYMIYIYGNANVQVKMVGVAV